MSSRTNSGELLSAVHALNAYVQILISPARSKLTHFGGIGPLSLDKAWRARTIAPSPNQVRFSLPLLCSSLLSSFFSLFLFLIITVAPCQHVIRYGELGSEDEHHQHSARKRAVT